MSTTLGIIGFGAMGGAIGRGLVAREALAASDLVVYDVLDDRRQAAASLGARVEADDAAVARAADVTLLAVKPQDAREAVRQASEGDALGGTALVSIVAGLAHDTLAQWTGGRTRILRIIPNTPAQVGAGAFGLSEATKLGADERRVVEGWLESIGRVEWVPEHLIDAVTGLSGGIPAYAALFIEALADGGVQQGLKRPVAQRLAAQAVLGTAQQILQTGIHPGALKDAVSSPAGTTIEGIRALEAGGVRSAVIEAVIRASERSKELGRG